MSSTYPTRVQRSVIRPHVSVFDLTRVAKIAPLEHHRAALGVRAPLLGRAFTDTGRECVEVIRVAGDAQAAHRTGPDCPAIRFLA